MVKHEEEAKSIKQHEIAPCSTLPPVPPRPKGKREAQLYWVRHTEEVLADFARLGSRATKERWNIGSSTLFKLRHGKIESRNDKHIEKRDRHLSQAEPQKSPSDTKVNHSKQKSTEVPKGNPLIHLGTYIAQEASELPPFPAFDSSWPMLTQIEWIKTYKELAGVKQ